ncbi:DUF934 domain-containing protein [Ketobacter sp.]|uniref:DUF934 domain-containing protein n=1 Tax=Ketobacter sp. TaxID=2083498 RepID=UPI000F0FF1FA|nr:DUF934 domain-containing protein [Ketobacter sp.]RLT98678.1 MAG: DUF934 domain-containing protein [Ketobacter sp.]
MPRKIIKDRAIVDDSYTQVTDVSQMPASGDILVALDLLLENPSVLPAQGGAWDGKIGIKVTGDVEPEALVEYLDKVDLIAIEFPVFRDGRGYSLARILRDRLGFQGELRACGDVLRDQMFYMQRCGFNSFEPRDDRSIEEALNGLSDFTVTYQADAVEKRPIYLRRP